jgi:hypothetical protein
MANRRICLTFLLVSAERLGPTCAIFIACVNSPPPSNLFAIGRDTFRYTQKMYFDRTVFSAAHSLETVYARHKRISHSQCAEGTSQFQRTILRRHLRYGDFGSHGCSRGGHSVAQWLSHYATSGKVSGSTPDEMNEFF